MKNWCLWTVALEKTLESLLDCKEIQPVHPKENQSCILIGRTDAEAEPPILWPPDVKSWLIEKDPDSGKDWRKEENGMTKDEMVGWHHQFDGNDWSKEGREWDDKGWDGWMASPIWWKWLEQLWKLVMDREAWHAAVHGITKFSTWLSNWTELTLINIYFKNDCEFYSMAWKQGNRAAST